MKLRLIILFIVSIEQSFAQVAALQAWDFNGLTGAETSVAATSSHVSLASSSIIRGAGLQPASLSNAFQASQWTTSAALADAILNDDYFAFSLQPSSGYTLAIDQLSCSFRRSSTGPDHFQWMYKINEEPLQLMGAEIIYTGTATNGTVQPLMSFLPFNALQHITPNDRVQFRLYGYNASGSTGTFAIGRPAGNDLALTGTVLSALSIQLEGLNLYRKGEYDIIQWIATADDCRDVFYVEQSMDGLVFHAIQKFPVQWGKHRYEWKQYMASNVNDSYYRLRMVSSGIPDRYSALYRLKGNPSQHICLYPNPVTSMLTLTGLNGSQQQSVILMDGQGKQLRSFNVSPGQQSLQMDVQALNPGNYYIAVPKNKPRPFLKE